MLLALVAVKYQPPHVIAYWDDLTPSQNAELYKQINADTRS